MPDDTQEKHTPGPWHVVPRPSDEKGCTVDTTEDSHIAKLIFNTPLADFLGRDEHSLETMRANARLIAAAPDLLAACEKITEAVPHKDDMGTSRPAMHASRAAHQAIAKARGLGDASDLDMPDQNERDAVGLTSAGKEVAELRDENERLKERVAELEEALADADQVIGVLKGAAAFLNAEGEKKGMPAAGNYRFWSKQCEEKKEMLEAAPLPDTDASQSASREAEVSQ